MRPAQSQAREAGRAPRLGTYVEGSQTSKGKTQGPCGIPRRNHVGLPAINARLSSRTEVLQLYMGVREICVATVNVIPSQPGFMQLGEA